LPVSETMDLEEMRRQAQTPMLSNFRFSEQQKFKHIIPSSSMGNTFLVIIL